MLENYELQGADSAERVQPHPPERHLLGIITVPFGDRAELEDWSLVFPCPRRSPFRMDISYHF